MPLADGTKIAGYQILRLLGSGGMGEVYLAQHPRLPRQDALKVLRADVSAAPDFVERFNREADLVAKLWHPHIVGIHDRGKHRGRLWISMDFVDGTDVSHLLQDRYPAGMPPEDAFGIVKAVAGALDYAHGRGLLHRDVKPANILTADVEHGDRRILLSDFGVARDLSDTTGGGLTATNMTVGTAAYAAPEQLMGLDVDGRADQYSLAATAYHLLAGAPLFQHSNPAVVIGQHLNAAPPTLAGVNPLLADMDAALSRALAKDPDERFASCMDFARALESADDPNMQSRPPSPSEVDTMLRPVAPVEPTPEGTTPSGEQSSDRGPRLKRFALAAAAAAVVVGLIAIFALRGGDEAAHHEPFTLAGIMRLPDEGTKTEGLPGGYKCVGAREYGDVVPGAPVTVEDESGKLLAKGAIKSSNSGRDSCLLLFSVDNVPGGAEFYRVQVAQRDEMNYTESEAKGGVEISVGSSNPSQTVTAAPSKPKAEPRPPTQTRTVTVAPSADEAALSRLRSIADDDRQDVQNYLADVWVPQISSKYVGLEAKGIQWDNSDILAEHLRLRNMYSDVHLLWAGDWSTYDGPNFWVTIVGLKSYNYNDVLAWCAERFGPDDCAAKWVSTTHPVAGSIKYNK